MSCRMPVSISSISLSWSLYRKYERTFPDSRRETEWHTAKSSSLLVDCEEHSIINRPCGATFRYVLILASGGPFHRVQSPLAQERTRKSGGELAVGLSLAFDFLAEATHIIERAAPCGLAAGAGLWCGFGRKHICDDG